MFTAIIVGATGLVGNNLLQILLGDQRFNKVTTFSRRSTGVVHPKLEEHVIDFNKPALWNHLVTGDVLFSALGTTLKQAGSKEAQYVIDHNYQLQFAKSAAENNVPVYVLVSSAGADINSRIFYSRMKGALEESVMKLPIRSIHIIKPGLLTGKRVKERTGEKVGYALLSFVNKLGILKKYKPVPAQVVAKAMLNAAVDKTTGIHSYELLEVFDLAISDVSR